MRNEFSKHTNNISNIKGRRGKHRVSVLCCEVNVRTLLPTEMNLRLKSPGGTDDLLVLLSLNDFLAKVEIRS